jgi:hypothetical protein
MEENRNANRVLVGTPENKRPPERPRQIWEHNIKMYLKETGKEGVEWVHLAQDRDQEWALLYLVMNLWVP